MCEASGPKPAQTIFFGSNGLFHTDGRALAKSELGIELTAQLCDVQMSRCDQMPQVIEVARLVARPVAQGQKLLDRDFLDRINAHGRALRQIVELVVGAQYRTLLQRETQHLVDCDVDLHIAGSRQWSL